MIAAKWWLIEQLVNPSHFFKYNWTFYLTKTNQLQIFRFCLQLNKLVELNQRSTDSRQDPLNVQDCVTLFKLQGMRTSWWMDNIIHFRFVQRSGQNSRAVQNSSFELKLEFFSFEYSSERANKKYFEQSSNGHNFDLSSSFTELVYFLKLKIQ